MFLKIAPILFAFRKELTYVALSFLIVLMIPIIAVILLTHTGLDVVSDKLAQKDEATNTVQLFYPTGELYKEIPLVVSWPVKGVITNEFGEAHPPFYLHHSGIDIANPNGKKGDQVTAFMPGKVIYAREIFWGFGKHVIIDHGNNITSIYAHLDKILVAEQQEIKTTTQVIGLEGSTGWSTGPHLHFEIQVWGIPINPRTFIGNGNPV